MSKTTSIFKTRRKALVVLVMVLGLIVAGIGLSTPVLGSRIAQSEKTAAQKHKDDLQRQVDT
ncbi:MAG TPA: hypothetical protein VK978_00625, partial [Candidatus Saccharimonadales bacterium]|nr:hypothetical protein [Candidatus Saccharimonadales bacterium]